MSETMKLELAEKIMEVKSKAACAPTEKEYSRFMEEYVFLRKRWEAVAGNAVIGIDIQPLKKAA